MMPKNTTETENRPQRQPSSDTTDAPHCGFYRDPVLKWEMMLALPTIGITGTAAHIVCVLMQCFNDEDGFAKPSQRFLARECGVSDRAIREAMPKVLASGLVTKRSGTRYDPDRYSFDWAIVNELVPADKKAFEARCKAYREEDARAATEETATGTSDHQTGSFASPDRKKDVTRPEVSRRQTGRKTSQDDVKLPANTDNNNTTGTARIETRGGTQDTHARVRAAAGASRVSAAPLGVKAMWSEFRDLYPNKKGMQNLVFGQFKLALQRASFEEIISGVERYIAHLSHQGMQGFDEQPANVTAWLMGDRWTDQYDQLAECVIAQTKTDKIRSSGHAIH